jgi:hypothetical protein
VCARCASTAANTAGARTVEGAASVSMGDDAASARTVEGAAFVSMADDALSAMNVEGAASVSMGDDAASARIVEGPAFVSMADDAADARIVEGPAFVSMADDAADARSAKRGSVKQRRSTATRKRRKRRIIPGPPSARGRRQEGRSAVRLPSCRSAALRCLSSRVDTCRDLWSAAGTPSLLKFVGDCCTTVTIIDESFHA